VVFLKSLSTFFAGGAWLGVRRSSTEPIVRVVVESADAQWVSHVVNTLQKP
jgi:phosphomannomutase